MGGRRAGRHCQGRARFYRFTGSFPSDGAFPLNDMKTGFGAAILDIREVRLKATRHGLMLYNSNDSIIGRSFDLYGEFSEGEVDLFRQLLQPGMVVLDIGANIGAHTLYFASAVGQRGRVIAYEPQRVIHQMLCANLALNSVTNVQTLHAGAGRERGITRVPFLDYSKDNNFGRISLGADGASERVDVIPVDALELERCHFMKIDVEGMEGEVVAGATSTIARLRPPLYIENDRREKSAALIEQLFSLEYELFWHLPRYFNPENFFRQRANAFGGLLSINMLCLPREWKNDVSGLPAVTGPRHWPLPE
jgi:FkbM family methyltransferase